MRSGSDQNQNRFLFRLQLCWIPVKIDKEILISSFAAQCWYRETCYVVASQPPFFSHTSFGDTGDRLPFTMVTSAEVRVSTTPLLVWQPTRVCDKSVAAWHHGLSSLDLDSVSVRHVGWSIHFHQKRPLDKTKSWMITSRTNLTIAYKIMTTSRSAKGGEPSRRRGGVGDPVPAAVAHAGERVQGIHLGGDA